MVITMHPIYYLDIEYMDKYKLQASVWLTADLAEPPSSETVSSDDT